MQIFSRRTIQHLFAFCLFLQGGISYGGTDPACNPSPALIADYEITTTGDQLVIIDISGNSDTLHVTENGMNIRFNAAGRTYMLDGGPVLNMPVDISLMGKISITVDAAAGNDVILVGGFTTVLPNLTIHGGTGDDLVRCNGPITFDTDAHLDLDLQNDDVMPGEDRIEILDNADIALTGSGAVILRASRDILIEGGSMTTTNGNLTLEANQQALPTSGSFFGVWIQNGAVLQCNGTGTVTIRGKGGDSGSNQRGIYLFNQASIIGGTSGFNTIVGTGGASSGGNDAGIRIDLASSITSGGGDVMVTGAGGGSGSSGNNHGIFVLNEGLIKAQGTGQVNVQGIGGNTTGNNNDGVFIAGTNSAIDSEGGIVIVTGAGGGEGISQQNIGVRVSSAGKITAGGTGMVEVTGVGGTTTGDHNYGVLVTGTNSKIFSNGGYVNVIGLGGGEGTSKDNYGVFVTSSGRIDDESTGQVTVTGTGGFSSGNNNHGVVVQGGIITSSGGDVAVTGHGGGINSSTDNYGIHVLASGLIRSEGMGNVMVEGTGGSSTGDNNYGVYVHSGPLARIASLGGDVSVQGSGGGSGTSGHNYGVHVASSGMITTSGSGTITVEGSGGTSSGDFNCGVFLDDAEISSSGASIEVTGQGNGSSTSSDNYGIFIGSSAGIIVPINLGSIALAGTGGSATGNNNHGVLMMDGEIATAEGDIAVEGNFGGGIDALAILQTGSSSIFSAQGNVTLSGNGAYVPQSSGLDVNCAGISGTLLFAPDLSFRPIIDGLTANVSYQQLNIEGQVNLNDVPLDFINSTYTPGGGDTFILVENDDSDPVIGIFNNLPEGSILGDILGSGFNAVITYTGGSGNDVVLTVEPCPTTNIIHVNASNMMGPYNGLSWSSAYASLQDALNAACTCTEPVQIWIAAGTYYPDEGAGYTDDDRTHTFQLCNNVSMYGGFTGSESLLSERDWETHETILSGDIQQTSSFDESSYTVVTGSLTNNTAVLDGFTITGGNAGELSGPFTDPDRCGGGMYILDGSPTITNCLITGNTAYNASGIFNNNSFPIFINCSIINNGSLHEGGGMYNLNSSPTLERCMINANSAFNVGGGLSNHMSSPTLLDCMVKGNVSLSHGGGMYNSGSSPILTNCLISGNAASENGGGLFNELASAPVIINSVLTGNTAPDSGGGMYNSNASPTITNSIIWNNRASGQLNSTSASIENISGSAPLLSYSLIANSGGSQNWDNALGTDNGSNIDANPLFITPVNPSAAPTTGGNLHLQVCSPAIDAGDNGANSTTEDLDGNERIFDSGIIDMGPYEFQGVGFIPSAPVSGGDQEECEDNPTQTLTAEANPPAGSSIVWYDAPVNGNVVTSPILNSVGTITYYAGSEDDVSGCISDSRTPVTLTIHPRPVCTILGDDLTCPGMTDILYSAPEGMTGYAWSIAGGGIITTPVTLDVVSVDAPQACNSSFTLTLMVTDAIACSSECMKEILVDDVVPPVVMAGSIEECYETIELAETAALAATTASDNCPGSLFYSVNTAESMTMTCDSVITVTVTDGCGNSEEAIYAARIGCQMVRLKVFLEGPYDPSGDSLLTTINNNHLLPGQNTAIPFGEDTPSGQPYVEAPWNYNGNSGITFGDPPYGTTPYPADVVDWILVSLREEGILPEHTIWTCAGWVHKDGFVTFPEACPDPVINLNHDYYILVQHRNHLGILSPFFVDIECGGAILQWDFTTADSYKPAFRSGQKQVETGVWAMHAANGEQIYSIQVISSPDRTAWRQQQSNLGYKKGDYNMNISVDSGDETLWKGNQNKTTGVIFY